MEIDRTSDAFREAEIHQGDVIVSINRTQVEDVNDFEEAYSEIESGSIFLMRIRRGGSSFRTALTKP
jgi:S1-C subfamily serine protease